MEFTIVENPLPSYSEGYEEFIRLYNANKMTVYDIRKKLGWTVKTYSKARKKALSEGRIIERNNTNRMRKRHYKTLKKHNAPKYYYYRHSLGKFIISKKLKVDGSEKTVYFGAYKNKKDCEKIVEELKRCGWDKSQLDDIIDRLNLTCGLGG